MFDFKEYAKLVRCLREASISQAVVEKYRASASMRRLQVRKRNCTQTLTTALGLFLAERGSAKPTSSTTTFCDLDGYVPRRCNLPLLTATCPLPRTT